MNKKPTIKLTLVLVSTASLQASVGLTHLRVKSHRSPTPLNVIPLDTLCEEKSYFWASLKAPWEEVGAEVSNLLHWAGQGAFRPAGLGLPSGFPLRIEI